VGASWARSRAWRPSYKPIPEEDSPAGSTSLNTPENCRLHAKLRAIKGETGKREGIQLRTSNQAEKKHSAKTQRIDPAKTQRKTYDIPTKERERERVRRLPSSLHLRPQRELKT
jgi:hypothetical protein